jgi:hypothetical protein
MKRTLIRYKIRPELAEKNAALISQVFEELKAAKPDAHERQGGGLEIFRQLFKDE